MKCFIARIFPGLLVFALSTTAFSQTLDISTTDFQSGQSIEEETSREKSSPEGNYLEIAINYINEKKYSVARKYLQLAQSSENEKIFQDAVLWGLFIDALEGKKNLENSINSLAENIAPKALYYVSDGWQTYYETNPEAKDIYGLSIEFKEKLIARFPESEFSILAARQLVPLFILDKNYDRALSYLLGYLDPEKSDQTGNIDDKAWFYLGQILENSREYRDLHKAIKAYQMVMRVKDSLFYNQAKNQIFSIEKFYRIIQ